MRLIIAGSRTLKASPTEILELIKHYKLDQSDSLEIVSGTAKGIDQCGEDFAFVCKLNIKRFPADWDHFGKSAGHRRNAQMAEYADALLLIWDGESKGSAGMKALMIKCGKPVYEAIVKV